MIIIRMQAKVVWLLIGLMGLVSCGPDTTQIEGVSTDIQIIYERQGGFAGITEEWIIYPDGRIIGSNGQEMKVPPQQVISLLANAAEIESSSLQESYVPDDACCDQFLYTITVKVGDQETTVQTSDGAEQPEQLSSLLAGIEDLLSAAEPIE